MEKIVQLEKLPLPVKFRSHSRARRIILRITPLEIQITLPKGVSEKQGMDFLESRREWIMTQCREFQKSLQTEEAGIPESINLLALEEIWMVKKDGDSSSYLQKKLVIDEEGQILFFSPLLSDREVLSLLRSWIHLKAKEYLLPWLQQLSKKTGISYKKGFIRFQKTRWGSCSSKGNINLNAKLLFLPPYLVQYVIIHELCHQIHFNHSKAFWKKVESYEPAYQIWEDELDQYLKHIPLWVLMLERL
ncbi:MAG: M48 family peptidase [Planctomycetota bacterium]|nr:MAG: M48 family peptidase [Planctomycetota bacterium]